MGLPQQLTATAALHVRELCRDDGDAVTAFYQGLSPLARRLRFHAPVPRFSPTLLDLLRDIDGERHMAVAVADAGRLLGVAHCVRMANWPDQGEVAFAVADDWQRCGLGTRLRQALAALARAGGITHFHFSILTENDAALRLLAVPGAELELAGRETGGRAAIALYLAADPVPAVARPHAGAEAAPCIA